MSNSAYQVRGPTAPLTGDRPRRRWNASTAALVLGPKSPSTFSAGVATTTTVLLGPALFLAGHALFKWVMWGRLSVARLLAIAALAALWPLGTALAPLLLSSVATLVVAAVAVSDTRTAHARASSPG